MKLEIDLMNADEVAAGLVLLSKIGEAQTETKATIRTIPPGVVVPRSVTEFIQRTQVEEGEQFYTPPQTQIAANIKDEHFVAGTTLDPAAVFGGTPVADPLPLSTIVPPPPVSIAPTTPIPGPVSSVAAVELDVKGLPWDSRIHSSSKNKLANGCWKVARGKAPEYVAQVESELKDAAGIPTAAVAHLISHGVDLDTATKAMDAAVLSSPFARELAGAPVPPPPPPVTADLTVLSPEALAKLRANVAAPGVIVPVPPAPNADPSTFETLMTRISPQISAGVLPPQAVMEACKVNGLQSVVGLQSSPQLVPLVWATLKATYPALV